MIKQEFKLNDYFLNNIMPLGIISFTKRMVKAICTDES